MKRFLETLTAWEGAVRGDAVHKRIVDAYNSYLPHPRGYRLTYSDDYCAAMVSAAAILCGLTEVLPIECSCGEQMRWYQARGQWIEDDAHVPQIGEQVFYCWNDRKDYALTDCTGAPNHTGIMTACDGKTFTVFEGNKGKAHECAYRILPSTGGISGASARRNILRTRPCSRAATRARWSASCKSFSTPAATSWTWITPSAPQRKGHGASTSPRTSSRP
ncbi:MAG: hypothetical protein ACLSHJ_06905 [Oscillospiraceae bacterium]